jgi:hypothetical protein
VDVQPPAETAEAEATQAEITAARRRLPALLFFWRRQDGPSRKMESLVAWVKVTQKKRLRVVDVDAESLVLIKDRRVVGRLEGRVTGREIDDLIRPHLH